ncbi:hypothetical protein Z043_119112 [Scleropages formosus]|uniref:PDZ domain-containing protein n=1 Tax=Scleropages formosus TaxID=113540 RepID=A0A0P7WNI8_SCLFO|nr:hypothetical protein Z043_119112 [Scleropages formosus]
MAFTPVNYYRIYAVAVSRVEAVIVLDPYPKSDMTQACSVPLGRSCGTPNETNREGVVTILRGKDGYGFTICSDSPVRVQAVDPGKPPSPPHVAHYVPKNVCGPAERAGLRQLDTLLQLNGQPVEQWKCVDLAHAIRNSHTEITVVVWRTGIAAKPAFEGLIHRPSYKPPVRDPPSPPTRRWDKTPPILRPVYQDNIGTLGRVYQTCQTSGPQQASAPPPSTAPHGRTTFLRRSTSSKTSKAPPPSGYQQNCNYANYQNCTIVRSHLPHANYGTYVKLAPKILIFPIFVQGFSYPERQRELIPPCGSQKGQAIELKKMWAAESFPSIS